MTPSATAELYWIYAQNSTDKLARNAVVARSPLVERQAGGDAGEPPAIGGI
ncbi:MAG: hypothetical protein ACQES2_01330 [Pseudomonadota bacterium]